MAKVLVKPTTSPEGSGAKSAEGEFEYRLLGFTTLAHANEVA